MADDPPEEKPDLESILERLSAEHGENVIYAVRRFMKKVRNKKGPSGRRGRPALADEVVLSAMADLLYLKAVNSERSAASSVADRVEGHSLDAKVHRLCRKFRERREQLMAEAAKRHNTKAKFAVESLTRAATVGDLRRRVVAKDAPRSVGDLRREYERLGFYNHLEVEAAMKEGILGIGAAAFEEARRNAEEMSRHAATAYEQWQRAQGDALAQFRRDENRLREIALGATDWRRLLGEI